MLTLLMEVKAEFKEVKSHVKHLLNIQQSTSAEDERNYHGGRCPCLELMWMSFFSWMKSPKQEDSSQTASMLRFITHRARLLKCLQLNGPLNKRRYNAQHPTVGIILTYKSPFYG